MIERRAFDQGMAALGIAFNRVTPGPLLDLYHQVLGEELTLEQFQYGVRELLRTARFFPPPAEILEAGRHAPVKALPPHRLTPAERAEQREQFSRGWAKAKTELKRRGIDVDRLLKAMPAGTGRRT